MTADPFAAAYAEARAATGPLLLTATAFDAAAMTVRRLWSSDPAAYPVGGAKPKRDTDWGRIVLLEGRVFVGEGEDAIRAHFADHATILALGLRSVVNVPVIAGGPVRGVLNMLWSTAVVPPERAALAERLAHDLAPAYGITAADVRTERVARAYAQGLASLTAPVVATRSGHAPDPAE